MSVRIDPEACVGCGQCLETCPFGAIAMQGDKAFITDACTSCGACIDSCPVVAIAGDARADGPGDLSSWKGVWVFAELKDSRLREVSLELLGEGGKLADELGEELCAVVIGAEPEVHHAQLIAHGARVVYSVRGEEYRSYSTDAYAAAFATLVSRHRPSVVLIGATNDGRDLGARVAARLKTGLTADCTALGSDPESRHVAWTRPAFGGNIMATILCPSHRPQMGTVRPKVFRKPDPDPARTGRVVAEGISVAAKDIRTAIVETVRSCASELCLEEAEIIVSGGRGLGKPEGFRLIEELAAVLHGTVGSSRAAVDAGWMPYPHQVGQTGKTVGPKVYFACGISGAIQHMAGMQGSDIIIAINSDPDAPIFKIANYGIVGDLWEVLPALTAKLREALA